MPETRPRITVLIPTFNRAYCLAECLESILSQTLPASQVVVIDDRSTDHTRDVLRPYMTAIEYVQTDEQVGRAGALNKGLERTTGAYVWTFDDDDVALPDALERFVEPLEKHPEHAFSYSRFYYAANRPEDGRIGQVLRESYLPDVHERGFLIPLLEANFLCGAALFARTSCYETVGCFDPTLLRAQDYEFGIRIARRFTGICVAGGPTFHYRQHDGLRGTAQDRFGPQDRLRKWLEYDQITFRRVYRDLPLVEYLPPGLRLEEHLRQAHLQRLAILATKLLMPEVMNELRILAQLSDPAPLSNQERRIIRKTINSIPFYMEGSLNDHVEFFHEVRRLARTSGVIRLMRAEMLRSLAARWRVNRYWRGGRQVIQTLAQGLRLYLPALSGRCPASE